MFCASRAYECVISITRTIGLVQEEPKLWLLIPLKLSFSVGQRGGKCQRDNCRGPDDLKTAGSPPETLRECPGDACKGPPPQANGGELVVVVVVVEVRQ